MIDAQIPRGGAAGFARNLLRGGTPAAAAWPAEVSKNITASSLGAVLYPSAKNCHSQPAKGER